MAKNYQCQFDFEEVYGGAIITEYDEDAPIVSVAKDELLDEMVKLGLTEEEKNELLKRVEDETIHKRESDIQAD